MAYYFKQLKASYIPKKVFDYLNSLSSVEIDSINNLYDFNSVFEMVTSFELKPLSKTNLLRLLSLVAQNIVKRGIPTLSPQILEETLPINSEELEVNDILGALRIYDKGYTFLSNRKYYQKNPDNTLTKAQLSVNELDFLTRTLHPLFAQYLEINKPIELVLNGASATQNELNDYTFFVINKLKSDLLLKLKGLRVNFALNLPIFNKQLKVALKVINNFSGDNFEENLNLVLKDLNWQNISKVDAHNEAINNDLYNLFVNYYSGIDTGKNLETISKIRIHIFTARVTLAILSLVEHGTIPLFSNEDILFNISSTNNEELLAFKLGVINALNLLYNLIKLKPNENYSFNGKIYLKSNLDENYYYLTCDSSKWQKVNEDDDFFKNVLSFKTRTNQNSKLDSTTNLNLNSQNQTNSTINIKTLNFNLRMYQRLFAFNPMSNNDNEVWLYSAYAQDKELNLKTFEKPIKYQVTPENQSNLLYFLRNIFFKEDFRPKQLDIIKEALERRNVIGLLPTGSGKTLTFQLSSMLQPGVSLIISPLVSLMEDQVSNLKKQGISSTLTINSNLTSKEKKFALNSLLKNKSQFIYIAPERLQIKTFKDILKTLPLMNVILDEAHCVSQWGHDFRTSYLSVGSSVHKLSDDIIIMALTGTASCNVVTDIKRELNMSKNVAIVTPTTFKRDELHFKVLFNDKPLTQMITDQDADYLILNTISELLQLNHINPKEIGPIDEYFFRKDSNNQYINSGIIFAPFAVGGKNENAKPKSTQSLLDSINLNVTKAIYHGQLKTNDKQKSQESFTSNEVGLLVATKAFGMGIDKPNIRFTIHVSLPDSIEAFYQEAGRAGRDRQNAVNLIIAPKKDNFEESDAYKIQNFFIESSFPNEQRFLDQAAKFLEEKTLSSFFYKKELINSDKIKIFDESFLELNFIENTGQVKVNLLGAKEKYTLYIDAQNNLNLMPQYNNEPKSSFIYSTYKTYMKRFLEEILQKNSPYIFNETQNVKISLDDNILESIEKASISQNEEPIYCKIDLSNNTLFNPINDIVLDLIDLIPNKSILLTESTFNQITQFANDYKSWFATNYREWFKDEKERKEYEKKVYDYLINLFGNFYKIIYEPLCLFFKLNLLSFPEFFNKYSKEYHKEYIGMKEKILYYLGALGIYSDYERYYMPKNMAVIKLNPITKSSLRANLRKFIANYETADFVQRQMKNFKAFERTKETQIKELVEEALIAIIDYSYDKIRDYRIQQSYTMFDCTRAENFTQEVYRYFEAKYTQDLLNDINNENSRLPIKWIKSVTNASKNNGENLLENLSHLRTSCLKAQEDRPQAFTPRLLYAYAIFNDHNLEITKALDAYIDGVRKLKAQRSKYSSELINFCKECFNTKDFRYLEEVDKTLRTSYGKSKNKSKNEEIEKILKELKEALNLRLQKDNHKN